MWEGAKGARFGSTARVATILAVSFLVLLNAVGAAPQCPPPKAGVRDIEPAAARSPEGAESGPMAGSAWYDLTSSLGARPSNRTQAGLAFDPALGGDLLFGGYNASSYAYGDTWEFANGAWTNLSPTLSIAPPPRWAALLTWDPAGQEMVLFGGRDASTNLDDTWVFNRTGWHDLRLPSAPSGRQDMVYGYDPNLSGVYLFGGSCWASCSSITYYNDSWIYSDRRWSDLTRSITGAPATLQYGSWDPADGYFLGYGNVTGCGVGGGFTFAFNGTAWRNLPGAVGPQDPGTGSMVYDGIAGSIFVFGESVRVASGSCDPIPATWTYTHGVWTNVTPQAPFPSYGRCCAALAYDPVQKLVLLEGGSSWAQVYTGEVWSYPARPLSVSANATGAPGAAPLPVQLSAKVSGGDGPIRLSWDFGDGTANGSGANPQHMFAVAGNYTVHLSAADAAGRGANATVRVVVLREFAVTGNASRRLGPVPLSVEFTGSYSGGEAPYQLDWVLNGGNRSVGADANYTYAFPGQYSSEFIGTDASGAESESQVAIVAYAPLALSLRESPDHVPVGSTLVWEANATGGFGRLTFTWSGLPAGCTSVNSSRLTCTPSRAGSYSLVAEVRDSYGDASQVSAPLTVQSPNSPLTPWPSWLGSSGMAVLEIGTILGGIGIAVGVLLLRHRSRPFGSPRRVGPGPP